MLDASGIERITVWPHRLEGDTVWDVVATLAPAAAVTFGNATATHIGQKIAVRIGDDVVTSALIESRIGARLALVSNVPKTTADSVATRATAAARCSAR